MQPQISRSVEWLSWADVVHQAVGMVSVQIDTDVGEAADRLVAEAEATRRPLECVAADVVDRRLRFV